MRQLPAQTSDPQLPAVPRTAAPRTRPAPRCQTSTPRNGSRQTVATDPRSAPRNASRQTISTDLRRVSEPPLRRVSNPIRQPIVTPLPAASRTRRAPLTHPRSNTPRNLPTPPLKSKRKKGQLHTTIQLTLPESCLGRELESW